MWMMANTGVMPRMAVAVILGTAGSLRNYLTCERVKAKGVPVVCEPTLADPTFFGSEVTHDLAAFKERCDLIVANRWSDELADVAGKVYTRDLFRRD